MMTRETPLSSPHPTQCLCALIVARHRPPQRYSEKTNFQMTRVFLSFDRICCSSLRSSACVWVVISRERGRLVCTKLVTSWSLFENISIYIYLHIIISNFGLSKYLTVSCWHENIIFFYSQFSAVTFYFNMSIKIRHTPEISLKFRIMNNFTLKRLAMNEMT